MAGTATFNAVPDRRRRRAQAVQKAVEYIEQNHAQRVTLQALAELTNLSLFRFATVFRNETGLPPHRYLCRIRVERAKALLRAGMPLAAVANEAGFFDQSHFSRHFKSLCGITPGRYLTHLRLAVHGAHQVCGQPFPLVEGQTHSRDAA